jgi:preprotein translocase subunit SecG
MFTVVLIIQLMVTIALVALVLLQKSEGGALGIGGGGGGGGLMSGRGVANLLTRSTAILAAAFFATSITLTIIARTQVDRGIDFEEGEAGAPAVLDQLLIQPEEEAQDPASGAPAEVDPPAEEEGPVIPDAD